MFLPKSKYTIKHSRGEFILSGSSDGRVYVGPYIEDYLGRCYAGKDISVAETRKLEKVEDAGDPRIGEPSALITLGPQDYASGSYVRYFRQNKVSKVIDEISKDQADQKGPWKYTSGSWIVTGSLDDIYIDGIPYRGVRYRNSEMLKFWEKKIPGIVTALNLKPEDFVQES